MTDDLLLWSQSVTTPREVFTLLKNIRVGRLVWLITHAGLQVVGLHDQVVQPLPSLQHLADVVCQDDFDLVDLTLYVVHLSRLAAGRLVRARDILRDRTTPVWAHGPPMIPFASPWSSPPQSRLIGK